MSHWSKTYAKQSKLNCSVLFMCYVKILAIYDRFGRLAYGSEKLSKDCLEYVVFEKHIADEYGCWRLHGKILPDWLPAGTQQPILRTMRRPHFATPTEAEQPAADSADSSVTSELTQAQLP